MKKSKLTHKAINKYIENDGYPCPFCGGPIEGGSIEIDAGHAYQDIHCLLCPARWQDIYKLCGLEVTVFPPKKKGGE